MAKFKTNRVIRVVGSNEVVSKAKRRSFSAKEKLRIIKEIESCKRGEGGEILRREGIYSSYIRDWRQQLNLDGLSGSRPGPKPKDKKDIKMIELEKRNRALERDLELTRALIDLQKKAFDLLGLHQANDENNS